MGDRTLDYVALCVLFFVVITIIYGIIYIHDIPYEMAKKRNHPHQDAIHTAGWVSLFLMHTIWPFLWIWATLYKPSLGWGFAKSPDSSSGNTELPAQTDNSPEFIARMTELEEMNKSTEQSYLQKIDDLQQRIVRLEDQLQPTKEV